jgi:DNA-binding GntR family transcriptional regulator
MPNGMDKLEKYLLELGPVDESDSRLLRQIAYDRLREAFRQVGLQPGDPLSENRISRALGISRTPVREALQELAKDGLVQVIPGRAITVAAPSIQDVLDSLHVRELLEPEVVRLVAGSLSAQTRQTLQELTQEMERAARAGDRPAWFKADIRWHEILSDSCPNQLLGQMAVQARNRLHNRGADNQVTDQYLIEGTLEHKQVIEAVIEGQGDLAKQIMLDHLRNVRENMFKRLVRY